MDLPVVWNSNAYEHSETLKLMEGLVDIYLPDLKYSDKELSARYSKTSFYPEVATKAILEMYRQTGHLKTFEGLAFKGLMIRLLVLPGQINNLRGSLQWIADNLGVRTHLSLMGQYYPAYRAMEYPELRRSISEQEYAYAVEMLDEMGFINGYLQEVGSSDDYTPDFR
jgi:putative pyruvate formate lyase activating enzyme